MTYPPDPEPWTWLDYLALGLLLVIIVGVCTGGIAYLYLVTR